MKKIYKYKNHIIATLFIVIFAVIIIQQRQINDMKCKIVELAELNKELLTSAATDWRYLKHCGYEFIEE